VIDFEQTLSIIRAFNREGAQYKVFGGMAVAFHGLPRTTNDADFLVDPSPENVVKIKRALRERRRADDPDLAESIRALWNEWRDLLPPLNIPKGVHKFRSIEEMNAFKRRYEDERIARLRAEREKK
jgi:hypothetical protein